MRAMVIGRVLCAALPLLVLSGPAVAQSAIASNCVKVEHYPPPPKRVVHDFRVTNICDFRINIRMFFTYSSYGKKRQSCITSTMKHAAYVNGPFSPGESRWAWAGHSRESDVSYLACAYDVDLVKRTKQTSPCWKLGTGWGKQCDYFWQGFRASRIDRPQLK